jgi:hypothetical protein
LANKFSSETSIFCPVSLPEILEHINRVIVSCHSGPEEERMGCIVSHEIYCPIEEAVVVSVDSVDSDGRADAFIWMVSHRVSDLRRRTSLE